MAKQRQSTATLDEVPPVALVSVSDPRPAETGLITVIERLAALPDVPMDKLRELIEMQERIIRQRAKAEFDAAFAAMQGELPTITERGEIKVDGKLRSRYARFEDIMPIVRPIMARHGFGIRHRNERKDDGGLRIIGILSHRGGHSEEDVFECPPDVSGGKSPIQAIGSTRSYGMRYTAVSLLNIVTAGVDTDGQAAFDQRYAPERRPSPRDGEAISEAQTRRLKAILTNAGHMEDTVRKWLATAYGCTLETIPKGEYDAICRIVERGEVLR